MRINGRVAIRSVLCAALLPGAMIACTSTTSPRSAPTAVPSSATIQQIEAQLDHRLARPGVTLAAELRQSGLLEPSGEIFRGRSAATSYIWSGHVVILQQGRPVEGWTLREKINRPDALFETRADGAEYVLLPFTGPSGASPTAGIATAYVVSGSWLVHIGMSEGLETGPVTIEQLRTFVAGLEF